MSTEITLANRPAFLPVEAGAAVNADFMTPVGGVAIPRLSFRQSMWRIISPDAEEEIIKNERGEPIHAIQVVALASNKGVYKAYYDKPYTPNQEAPPPTCWSNDGVAPSAASTNPQARECATCPKNQLGSKINPNGSKVKACSDSKRLLVVAPDDIGGQFYTIHVPYMSVKELNVYLRELNRYNVPVDAIITDVSVDPSMEYLKLGFKHAGWLSKELYEQVQQRKQDETVLAFMDGAAVPENVPASSVQAAQAAPAAAPPAQAQIAAPAAPAPSGNGVSPLRRSRGRKGAEAPQTSSFAGSPRQAEPAPVMAAQATAAPVAETAAPAGDDLDSALDGILDAF